MSARSSTLCLLAFGVAAFGCHLPPPSGRGPYTIVGGDPKEPVALPDVGQAEWTVSRERLARMRSELPRVPWVERIQIEVVDPRTGKTFRSRGAVAVSPGKAARLLLLGPGGATALDVWVTKDRFRMDVPALKLQRRGGSDLSAAQGLPIGLLRWWFLSPLDGKLVVARSSQTETLLLLRADSATVTIRTDGERLLGIRRDAGRLEALEWTGRALRPTKGARGRYVDAESRTRVDVFVEDVLPDEPDPAAFVDPDETGAAL